MNGGELCLNAGTPLAGLETCLRRGGRAELTARVDRSKRLATVS